MVDVGVSREQLGNSVVRGGDDVENTAWEVGARGGRSQQRARPWCVGRGLEDHRAPAAKAEPIFVRLSWNGKFHGVIAATTPAASLRTTRADLTPMIVFGGKPLCSKSYELISSVQ